MLRAAVLLSFLRRLQRFSTISHPIALVACYAAPWQLPRPDLHRLADDSFRTHQRFVRPSSTLPPRSASYLPVMWKFIISIDEWNQFARSLSIRPVGISEFLGKHFLLHPDSVEEDRDQK